MTSRSRRDEKEQIQGPRPHEVTYSRAEKKKEVINQEQQKKENE